MTKGVLIAGLRGATGSTLVATAMSATARDLAHLVSESEMARPLDLPAVSDLRWGGWDVIDEPWRDTLVRHRVLDPRLHPGLEAVLDRVVQYPVAVRDADHAAVTGELAANEATGATDGAALLDRLRGDIRDFRARTGAGHVVVVYLATPALLPPRDDWPQTARAFEAALADGAFATAAPYYIAAAILEGAAVVDYTASPTLEMPGLQALAAERGAPLAGRDGSTGQTLLKSVLAEIFAARRLTIDGWYSTNILGNHDGLVLADERFADVKKIDKTALLPEIVGYDVPAHLVDIRYYAPAGDDKEAWDAIDFSGWFGCRGQLRLNWRCSDSLIATPALIDLIRFSAHAAATGRAGIQPYLGVFFKYPLGTRERRYLRLYDQLRAFCEAEVTQAPALAAG